MNITSLDNCPDTGKSAPVHLTEVTYEINKETNLCEAVHGKFFVETVDTDAKDLIITFYKCEGGSGPCTENAQEHEEHLHCERFKTDDSGPWHMFSSSMSGSQCGEETGSFELNYSILKLKYLIKYLDLEGSKFNRFSLRMYFYKKDKNLVRGCGNIDFNLV